MLKEFKIKTNDANQRLDNFILKAIPKISRVVMYKIIRKKDIKVNNKKVDIDYKLVEGDIIKIYLDESYFNTDKNFDFLNVSNKIKAVYEDANILIMNKPPGLVVHEDNSHTIDTLLNRMKHYLYDKGEWNPEDELSFEPSLVNRIDRNTCGIVIAAKNAEALKILNEKIRDKEIKKYYLCVVYGELTPKGNTLHHYLYKDSQLNKVYVSLDQIKNSKEIITKYKTWKFNQKYSLLEIELITGRTHQIRAHMNFINHPLLGERKYTNKSVNKDSRYKYQALASYKLTFSFTSDAGILNYLHNKSFKIKDIWFKDII